MTTGWKTRALRKHQYLSITAVKGGPLLRAVDISAISRAWPGRLTPAFRVIQRARGSDPGAELG